MKEAHGKLMIDNRLSYALEYCSRPSLVSIDLENLYTTIDTNQAIDLESFIADNTARTFEVVWGHRMLNRPGCINYIDYRKNDRLKYHSTKMGKEKQIFSSRLLKKNNERVGINDVLSFYLHPNDTFIAKVLISIIIYKRNNQIIELTSEDYNHIFDVLYKEKVTIKEDVEKDFPRLLEFIPKKRI